MARCFGTAPSACPCGFPQWWSPRQEIPSKLNSSDIYTTSRICPVGIPQPLPLATVRTRRTSGDSHFTWCAAEAVIKEFREAKWCPLYFTWSMKITSTWSLLGDVQGPGCKQLPVWAKQTNTKYRVGQKVRSGFGTILWPNPNELFGQPNTCFCKCIVPRAKRTTCSGRWWCAKCHWGLSICLT